MPSINQEKKGAVLQNKKPKSNNASKEGKSQANFDVQQQYSRAAATLMPETGETGLKIAPPPLQLSATSKTTIQKKCQDCEEEETFQYKLNPLQTKSCESGCGCETCKGEELAQMKQAEPVQMDRHEDGCGCSSCNSQSLHHFDLTPAHHMPAPAAANQNGSNAQGDGAPAQQKARSLAPRLNTVVQRKENKSPAENFLKPKNHDQTGRPVQRKSNPASKVIQRDKIQFPKRDPAKVHRTLHWLRSNYPFKSLKEYENAWQKVLTLIEPGDHWLGRQILEHGPEYLWSDKQLNESRRKRGIPRFGKSTVTRTEQFKNNKDKDVKLTHKVDIHFFRGTSNRRALVVGGVHGSEQGGIQIVEMLIKRLEKTQPCMTTIVIPTLFQRNADNAYAKRYDKKWLGNRENKKRTRYTPIEECPKGAVVGGHCVDPNRNLPKLGENYDPKNPVDHEGRPLLTPNVILMELIERFKPERIASVHAHSKASHSGFFADPHLNKDLQFDKESKEKSDADWDLAIRMAQIAKKHGAKVKGNKLKKDGSIGKDSTAIIGGSTKWTKVIDKKDRNKRGNSAKDGAFYKPSGSAKGASLGDYASTGTKDNTGGKKGRKSISIFTIEPHKYHRSKDLPGDSAKPSARLKDLLAHTIAIEQVFLECEKKEEKKPAAE